MARGQPIAIRGRATMGSSCDTRRIGLGGARAPPNGQRRRSHAVQKGGKPHSLKNQIRDVQRLLHKPDLDPRARRKQVAILEALQAALVKHQRAELERKYAVRYHKIRFFERVKLERQIRHLEKTMTNGMDSREQRAQLARLHDDLQYVVHFPRGEKYVSIMKQADSADDQALLDVERNRLRALVSQQLAEVAMLAEPDEGIWLPAGSASAPADGTVIGDASDHFFLQERDLAVGAQQPAGHGNTQSLAKVSSEPKHSGSKGFVNKREKPLGKIKASAATKKRSPGSHLQHLRPPAGQTYRAVDANWPVREILPAMPQRTGVDGLTGVDPARGDPTDCPRAVHVEDGAAGGSAGDSHCRQGKHVMTSARAAAARNRSMVSMQRTGPLKKSAGRAEVQVVAAAREPIEKLPLRTRAEGGRKRRNKAQ